MKLERVSEYQISCTLSGFDLIERNMELGELAYGSQKARQLLREMMQRASSELGFEVDNMPLRVESIPLSDDSIQVLITKVDDPEELDARFSRFVPPLDGDYDERHGIEDLLQELENKGAVPPYPPPYGSETMTNENKTAAPEAHIRGFRFPNLNAVIAAAHAVRSTPEIASEALYRDPKSGYYILTVKAETETPALFAALCNRLSEYAEPLFLTTGRAAYFAEHYRGVLAKDVLNSLSKL